MQHPEVLAEAAAGLSRQLLALLQMLGEELKPHLPALDKRYGGKLKQLKYTADQGGSLREMTMGAAALSLAGGGSLAAFLEQVQYRGRRLAKLGVTPAQVVAALREYDDLFDQRLRPLVAERIANLEWVRSQLHFLVVLTLNNAFYQVREAESRAFYELYRAEVEAGSLQETLSGFLRVLGEYTGAQAARLYLVQESGECVAAACLTGKDVALLPSQGGEDLRGLMTPRCIDLGGGGAPGVRRLVLEEEWKTGFATCWSVPLLADGKLKGVMQFAFLKPYRWLPRELDLLQGAAERGWRAAEKARLLEDLAAREEQVRRLAEHMVEVEESERRRISRELHDEAGQSLLCIRLQMEMLEQDLAGESGPLKGKLLELREMTEHTILEIRRLIAALSPAILEQMGLAAALRQLVGRFRRVHPAEVRIQLPRRLELPKRVQIIVYRLVQEILNNIAKYSMATHVNLQVDSADGCLRLQVEDDGVGFDVEEALARKDCFGLSGLRERVALLGGKLAVQSRKRTAADGLSAGKPATLPGVSLARATGQRGKTAREKAGQVGIDLHGTGIWVELPLAESRPGAEQRGRGASGDSAAKTRQMKRRRPQGRRSKPA